MTAAQQSDDPAMSAAIEELEDLPGPEMSRISWTVEPVKERSRLGVVAMPESYPATPLPPGLSCSSTFSHMRKHFFRIICVITVVLLTLFIAGTALGVLSLRGGKLHTQFGKGGAGNESRATTGAPAQTEGRMQNVPNVAGSNGVAAGPTPELKVVVLQDRSPFPNYETDGWSMVPGTWPEKVDQELAKRTRE